MRRPDSKPLFPARVGRWRLFFCLAALVSLPLWSTVEAQPTVSKEYQVKAAFLFHFMQFVEWPQTAFTDTNAPVRIGILGEDPFGPALDDVIRGETIQGRRLEVRHAKQAGELKDCQILFINASEKSEAPEILATLGGSPVLTVSETRDFAQQGGMINFFTEEKKIRFEINPDAAEQSGLKISSQLLRLGKIVRPKPKKGEP